MAHVSMKKLRRGMAEQNLSIEDVAKYVGASEIAVRQWMRGARKPRVSYWPRLEMLFPDVIVDEKDAPTEKE